MAGKYLEIYFTPEVLAAQQHYFGRPQQLPPQPDADPLTDAEREFCQRSLQNAPPVVTSKCTTLDAVFLVHF